MKIRNVKLPYHFVLFLLLVLKLLQVMDLINVNADEKGREIDFKELLYGYYRLNPLYGADYIFDLLLTYKKFRGHKMTVPVRKHVYLHQAFTGVYSRWNSI